MFFSGRSFEPELSGYVQAAYESGQSVAKQLAASKHSTIAIIGAGISGIGAAKLLTEQGKNVVILEGRNRIGGRIWTDRNQLGTTLDLGA